MHIRLEPNPSQSIFDELEKNITDFNVERWEVKEKQPLACTVRDKDEQIIAGGTAKTFGLWMMIENIWVHESLRGQSMGSKILQTLEEEAKKRNCRHVLLDTLNFQAKDFYLKHGYQVQWTQQNYPKEGCKYFMTKDL